MAEAQYRRRRSAPGHLDALPSVPGGHEPVARASATRSGRYSEALTFMERSLILNPGHADTEREIENLRGLLAAQTSDPAGGTG